MKQGCLHPPGLVPQPSPHLPHSLTLISSGSGLCLLLDCYVHTDAAIKSHQCPQSPHSPSPFDLKRHSTSQSPYCALWLLLWFITVTDRAHKGHGMPKSFENKKIKQLQRDLRKNSMIRATNWFHLLSKSWLVCTTACMTKQWFHSFQWVGTAGCSHGGLQQKTQSKKSWSWFCSTIQHHQATGSDNI